MTTTTTSTSQFNDPGTLRNRTFDEIAVGDAEGMERTLTARDI
jgi:acyl dehydratase